MFQNLLRRGVIPGIFEAADALADLCHGVTKVPEEVLRGRVIAE